jgi:hypothetical protein
VYESGAVSSTLPTDQGGKGCFHVQVKEQYVTSSGKSRKQVNLDIIQKFRETTDMEPPCPDIFGLTSNSLIIRNYRGQKAEHYYSDQRNDTLREKNVTFIHAESDEAQRQQVRAHQLYFPNR